MEAIAPLSAVEPAPTSAQAAGPTLCLASISKSWGARKVLDEVTLELRPGTLTWLAGPNGVGKTTLLRIACGLVAADHGSVEFDGLNPRRDRRSFQRRLGFLSAGDRGMYARLSGQEHLFLWGRLALLPGGAIDAAVERIVALLGIEDILALRTDRMSMGQRQRLRLAMTFLHSPDLVLLDEPLTSLDQTGVTALRRCIAEVVERAGVVVWCSPGTDRAQAPHARRLWLEHGKVTEIS